MCQPGRPGPISVSQKGSPGFGCFPKGEVVDALLLVLVGLHPLPRLEFVQADLGKPPVGGELGDAEVDGTFLAVGVSLLQQAPDDRHHLGDMLRGPGVDVRGQDPECPDVLEESLLVFSRVLAEGDPLEVGPADRFVVDVGDIHDVGGLETHEKEEPFEQVLEDVGPVVPDMRVVVDRGTAGIEFDGPGGKGFERLHPAVHRVEEPDHNPLLWPIPGVPVKQIFERPPFVDHWPHFVP